MTMDGICPTVARAAAEGFDLVDLSAHMLECEVCQPILTAMMDAMRPGFEGEEAQFGMADDLMTDVPDWETLTDWVDDGGCEATDGCWVEVDGVCPHGKRSWALVMGLV